jgi:uncharacterized protein (TIGR02145 family)
MACDFICFSYNSTTVSLPAVNYTVGATLPTHSMDGSTDFLYQRISGKSISAEDSSLAFDNLWHQLAKVTLVFNTSYNKWPITAVNPNALPTIGPLAIPSGFTLTNDTPPSGSATTQSFTEWPATFGLDQTEASSGELRVVPVSTSTDFTLTIPAGAVTLSGPSTASQPTAKKTYTITTALEKGKSYTVRMKPYLPKFAGSNIYWDSSKSQLTFDDHDDYTNTKYQGVHFKWGSLIGVSPAQTNDSKDFSSGTAANGDPNDSNVTLDGTPIYMKDPDGNWVKTNVAYATSEDKSNGKERWFGENSVGDNTSGSNGAWSPIPYGSTDGPYGTDKYNLLTNHSDFAGYRGDICNYINPAYRMPTSDELKALYNSNSSTYYSGFSSSSITNQTADGKTALAQFGTFTGISSTTYYLPASGYRANSSGMLYFVGDNGYSWSGSASVSGAYYLRFDSSDASASMSNTDSEFGFSVRCVKN